MIRARELEILVADSLQEELTKAAGKPCVVLLANQAGPAPGYPYASYTITALLGDGKGSYGGYGGGVKARNITQTWSITIQSDDATQCMALALCAREFFEEHGRLKLSDGGIVVAGVGRIGVRDNFITVAYEHRCGFDVTFTLLDVVKDRVQSGGEVIETAQLHREEE